MFVVMSEMHHDYKKTQQKRLDKSKQRKTSTNGQYHTVRAEDTEEKESLFLASS